MASELGPSVSLIIVSYNGRNYLGPCLESIGAQSYPMDDIELILVDNGSKDGTASWVRSSYPWVTVLEMGRNLGFAGGSNEGARRAKGKYLAFLNQDTIVHKEWLSKLVEEIERDETRGLCHCCTFMPWTPEFSRMELDVHHSRACYYDVDRWGAYRYLCARAPAGGVPTLGLTGGAFLLRRSLVEKWGYVFDDKFAAYCEDLDLGLRIWTSGHRVMMIPDSVVFHNQKMRFLPDAGGLSKALRASRNRLMAFWRNCFTGEFFCILPLLLVGMVLKPIHLPASLLPRLLMGLAMIALAPVAMVLAAWGSRITRKERRQLLLHRKKPECWVLRQLIHRDLS